ncbi:hypothetical protein JW916_08270 [Candidatus Sumerlaeota bacterium]|nr:hypothetical protein [Candidatus Sumerlaeota bacterium]
MTTCGKTPLLKPKNVFKDTSPAYSRKRRWAYARMAMDCAAFLPRLLAGSSGPAPFSPRIVSPEAFGMNLAPSPEPEGDAIQLAALDDLGVRAVRIDYAASAPEAETRAIANRLIERILDSGRALTLHVVQDPLDASAMDAPATRREFRAYLDGVLERYGGRIEALEVGSTPNRHSWSGYTPRDYALACRSASEAIEGWSSAHRDRARPLLVGPNISDFAPYFTVGQLAACRRAGVRFDVMSDNLFIDRTGAPEAWDPHVAGRALKGVARMDLVRKQRVLAAISRRFGISRCWSTYTHYTLSFGHVRPRYVSEDDYASYMVRQHLLTVAAGAFERIYWGTLVSRFKGLIDEGVGVRPYPPFVHHRFATHAPPDMWHRRERFFKAYRTVREQVRGARFLSRHAPVDGTVVLEFEDREGRALFVGWMYDDRSSSFDPARTGEGRVVEIVNRDGEPIDSVDGKISLSGSPVYWRKG